MGVPKNEGQSSHNFPPPQTFALKIKTRSALTIKENNFWAENSVLLFAGRKLALIQHFTNVCAKKNQSPRVPHGFSYFCHPIPDCFLQMAIDALGFIVHNS